MKEMFKPEHYKEVGTFFRFTTNLRNVNAKTETYYFSLPDATGGFHYTTAQFTSETHSSQLNSQKKIKIKPHSLPHMVDSNGEFYPK